MTKILIGERYTGECIGIDKINGYMIKELKRALSRLKKNHEETEFFVVSGDNFEVKKYFYYYIKEKLNNKKTV